MQVLHQVIPQPGNADARRDVKVLVTAAPIAMVNFYSAIFSRAGLVLEELETEAFALERSLVGHDAATSLVVDIGGERTNFFIVDQGCRSRTARSISEAPPSTPFWVTFSAFRCRRRGS